MIGHIIILMVPVISSNSLNMCFQKCTLSIVFVFCTASKSYLLIDKLRGNGNTCMHTEHWNIVLVCDNEAF